MLQLAKLTLASYYNLWTALPALVLVITVAVGLGSGYYFAYADSSPAKVAWLTNPLFITFVSESGSGSGMASDPFTCSQTVAPVTLQAVSNQPGSISLTVSPAAFPGCGSTPDNVIVTTVCTSEAATSQSCLGNFTGRVTVCGPTPYTCLHSRSLIVVIRVTST